ncbi:hypothetical protein [Acinetobacter genomosp. 15BJ]|uniref:Uncharacterized protein n=1 Tax=Acinetobacter genomosp. 15BJ TaxID=106651 RepID=R9B980_9GAMM|nr:hypothetical protein [Acinetobacter genomosp. 15BJ]EOR08941.1 hypothetical protein F896_01475 [Acinetobacter genomosp. 15BJ]MCH7290775.1 hypothetical protein [Acinetobacter genomosp. 15BJ]MDO3657115.1 hypothetical protein [Acinetobacter genomosp. 15BJ]
MRLKYCKSKAIPRGDNATAEAHTGGKTTSKFTSWTTDINVARRFATEGNFGNGVILQKNILENTMIRTRIQFYLMKVKF